VRVDGERCAPHPGTLATSCEQPAIVSAPAAPIPAGDEPAPVDRAKVLDVGEIDTVTACIALASAQGAEHIVELASPERSVRLAPDPGAGSTCFVLDRELAGSSAHGEWELRAADPDAPEASSLLWWSLAIRRR
jgi:hypothetical protein